MSIPASRESQVLRACLDLLALHRIPALRNQSGARPVDGRYVRFGQPGSADILACLPPAGRLLAVECKKPGGTVAKHQREWLDRWAAAGALCLVVDDVRQLEDALQVEGAI